MRTLEQIMESQLSLASDSLLRKMDKIGDKLANMEMMNGDNAPSDWQQKYDDLEERYRELEYLYAELHEKKVA